MCGIFCFYYFNVPGGTHDTSVKMMFFPLRILISLPVFAGGRVFCDFVIYVCFTFVHVLLSFVPGYHMFFKSFGFGKSEFVYVNYLLVDPYENSIY